MKPMTKLDELLAKAREHNIFGTKMKSVIHNANPKDIKEIVALSGGYSQKEAIIKLSKNHNLIASFSRALLQDLRVGQSDKEFDKELKAAIVKIYEVSIT